MKHWRYQYSSIYGLCVLCAGDCTLHGADTCLPSPRGLFRAGGKMRAVELSACDAGVNGIRVLPAAPSMSTEIRAMLNDDMV